VNEAIGWALAALAAAGGVYMIIATVLAIRLLRSGERVVARDPAVTLIKPLHGVYPGMDAALEGYCTQDFDGAVQIVFGVHDDRDPAVAVVRALQARRPETDIDLVIDGAEHGANRKMSNVINIAARARHPVLVMSDADIAAPKDYLRRVSSALAAPGVGAVSCVYLAQGAAGFWSRLGAMSINYAFLPNLALGKAIGMAHPCMGSTIALRAETLEAIGGFAAFADHLADDYEIGRAVRARGLRVAIPALAVTHLGIESSLSEVIDHEIRWNRTVRQIDPVGYFGSVITHPLALSLLAGLLLLFCKPVLALIFVLIGVRLICKLAMDSATGTSAGPWWMIPARDVLSLGIFIAGLTVDTVGWQGRRYRVGRDGVLSHP